MPRPQEPVDEQIGYQGSVATPDATEDKSLDEEDFSTLKHVYTILNDAVKECDSIQLIELESQVPVEQQVLAFQAASAKLETTRLAVYEAIGEVKRKQRGIK